MSLFNPLVPTGLVKLSFDYKNLQNNNQQLDTSFGINHFKFSDQTTNNGKHQFVEMPLTTTVVPAGLAAGEGTIFTFSKLSRSELYYTDDNSGKAWQLTSLSDSNFASFSTNPGWTFLPGGLLLQYGVATVPAGPPVNIVVSFSRTFGAFYTVNITPRTSTTISGGNHDFDVSGPGTTGFAIAYSGYIAGDTFFWTAIGSAS